MPKKKEPTASLVDQAQSIADAPDGEMPANCPVFSGSPKIFKASDGSGYVAEKPKKRADDDDEFVKISNFVITKVSVYRRVDDGGDIARVMTLTSKGISKSFPVPDSDVCTSRTQFRKWLASCGGYQFTGNDAHMDAVLEPVLDESLPVETLKHVLGYDEDRKVWVFDNCVIAGGKLYTGEKGQPIDVAGQLWRLEKGDSAEPALSRSLWTEPVDHPERLVREVMAACVELWGQGTEIVFGWIFSSLWRTEWIAANGSFPLASICGPMSRGKTELMVIAMSLLSRQYKKETCGNLTEVGYYTLLTARKNWAVWIDEFKLDVSAYFREALKGNYNAVSRTVGTLKKYETKSRLQSSGAIVSGETRPKDQALDSRILDINIEHYENAALWQATTAKRDKLSAYTIYLLLNWESLWKQIRARHIDISEKWRRDKAINQRLLDNYAKVLAALDVLFPDPAREERFRQWCIVKQQDNSDVNPLLKMLRMLPFYLSNSKAVIPHLVNTKKRQFYVHAQNLAIIHARESREVFMPPKQLIQWGMDSKLLIPGHPAAAVVREVPAGPGGKRSTHRCFIFDLTHPLVREVVDELAEKRIEEDDPRIIEGPEEDPSGGF